MTGNLHNCCDCGGSLALSYSGWHYCLCSRKFLIPNGPMSEMWWRNLSYVLVRIDT